MNPDEFPHFEIEFDSKGKFHGRPVNFDSNADKAVTVSILIMAGTFRGPTKAVFWWTESTWLLRNLSEFAAQIWKLCRLYLRQPCDPRFSEKTN